MEYIKGT
jgi:hypothetical protein